MATNKQAYNSTLANVASDSAAAASLFASNVAARGRYVFNDSTAVLYLKFGTVASSTSHTVQIAAGGYYEFPIPLYTGAVTGRWSATNGNARTTELY
jgi:hypothetical protein